MDVLLLTGGFTARIEIAESTIPPECQFPGLTLVGLVSGIAIEPKSNPKRAVLYDASWLKVEGPSLCKLSETSRLEDVVNIEAGTITNAILGGFLVIMIV